MQTEQIEFVIADDPDSELGLIQEAWMKNEIVADVRQVEETWYIRIFSETAVYRELSWQALEKIYATFSHFIQETNS